MKREIDLKNYKDIAGISRPACWCALTYNSFSLLTDFA